MNRRIGAFALYALSIAAVIGGFFLVQSFGRHLLAPPAPITVGGISGSTHTAAADLLHILLALVTVVAAARLVGLLFRFIQQPPVVGEIVAGIMLGPSLLGRFAPELSGYLFPNAVVPALNVISQVGVILFMFLIGLELDIGLLRRRGHATVAISHASIIAPFLLGVVVALLLYPRLSTSSVPFGHFALFLGVSMSITAFPVLARILTDRRISRTRLGVIALTCAAVDDLTAWCLLALVVGIARADGSHVLRTVVLAMLFIVAMATMVRPLMARLEVLYGHRGRLTQGLMAIIFVALLLCASATELIGIHAIFGAFALGAVIRHDSGMARELTDRLEDFVVVLLLPAFFAFTGLRTQIGLLNSPEQWLLCGLIIAVASVGKFGGTVAAARLTGVGWREGAALGTLMNTRGLMELIVLNIGFEMHIIAPVLFAMMVLMAVVTTMGTTPILHLIMRERLTPEPLSETRAGEGRERGAILAPIANPEGVGKLVKLAIAASPVELPPRVVAMVRPPAGGVRTNLGDHSEQVAPRSAALAAALEIAWNKGAVITPQAIWSDDPAADLLKIAAETRIGWMLLGPHRAVFGADYRGGIVRTVLDRAQRLDLNVAVLMVDADRDFERIFVLTDTSPDGRAALELGVRLARNPDVTLHVIRVARMRERIEPELSRMMSAAVQTIGRRLHTEVMAEPTLAMVAERTGNGLVIVAAHLADQLDLARRGFPDRRPMVLVQGSRFPQVSGAAANTATS